MYLRKICAVCDKIFMASDKGVYSEDNICYFCTKNICCGHSLEFIGVISYEYSWDILQCEYNINCYFIWVCEKGL